MDCADFLNIHNRAKGIPSRKHLSKIERLTEASHIMRNLNLPGHL